jgi:glycogen(starch) synthase
MKIGLFTNEHPILGSHGGVWSYVHELASGLTEIGHSSFIIVASPSAAHLPFKAAVPTYPLETPLKFRLLPYPLGRGPSLIAARQLVRLAVRLKLDVLEIPEGTGIAALVAMMKPASLALVVRIHGADAILRPPEREMLGRIKVRSLLLNALVRRSILAADTLSVPSTQAWENVQERLKVKSQNISIVPCPVADSFFRSTPEESSDPILLCVGRLGWIKGDDVLIRAMPSVFEHFPNAVLRFAGEHHDTQSVALRAQLPDAMAQRIEFLGQVSQEHIRELLQQSQVCVFPSRWESFGIACAESMVAGRAVIVSDAPGFRALVRDGVTGLMVARGDVGALAYAICRMLRDRMLRARLALAGQKFVGNLCNRISVATQAADLYQESRARLKQPEMRDANAD